MKRLHMGAPCALVVMLALEACGGDEPAPKLPLAECAWPFEESATLESDEGLFTATYECLDPRGCEDKAFLPGASFELGLALEALGTADYRVGIDDEISDSVFRPVRDRCTNEVIAYGHVTLGTQPEATFSIYDHNLDVLDSVVFYSEPVASIVLESADLDADGMPGTYDEAVSLTLDAGSAVSLRALALAENNAPLITTEAVFWIDDESLAVLGPHEEPGMRAATTTLEARSSGSTELHVLISNVEHVVPLAVR